MPVTCPGDSSLVKNNFVDSSKYVFVISKVDVFGNTKKKFAIM